MADEHDHEHTHDHDHGHDHGHEHEEPDYAGQIEELRADKDAWFRGSHDSPIPHDERAAFTGLPYYPPDETRRIEGLHLEPYAGSEPQRFAIPTSDGQLRPAHRAGTFAFDLDGQPRRLTAYVLDGSSGESLFVPFLDATSGTETYGAGRYLDLEPEEDETYALDFNLAYHPYCVYADSYSCPLTPAENRLSDRIEAGERLPVDAPAH